MLLLGYFVCTACKKSFPFKLKYLHHLKSAKNHFHDSVHSSSLIMEEPIVSLPQQEEPLCVYDDNDDDAAPFSNESEQPMSIIYASEVYTKCVSYNLQVHHTRTMPLHAWPLISWSYNDGVCVVLVLKS